MTDKRKAKRKFSKDAKKMGLKLITLKRGMKSNKTSKGKNWW